MTERRAGALPAITFILGGARSGKTLHAMRLAEETGLERVYVATGWAGDDEMAERIARHRRERGASWQTIEDRTGLGRVIANEARPGRVLLIDCLTLWLSNLILEGRDVPAESNSLISALHAAAGRIILVSNEVGLGLVPETRLGRVFRDEQGRLNQAVAAVAQNVIFVAAGLPLTLKSTGPDQ